MLTRSLIVLAALLLAVLAQDYTKPGPYAYQTTSAYTFDMPTSTGCAVERDYCDVRVEVTYPTAQGSYPLVVYSNGFTVAMRSYRSYSDRFGSWGYVTVRWTPNEGALGGVTQSTRGKMAAELINWAINESKNPSSPFYGKIDTSKGVIQSGHSLGGKTALLGAINHPSVAGFVLMDPVDCPPPVPPGLPYDDDNPNSIAMMNQTKAIGAYIGAELGDIGELIPCAPVECNYQRYYNNATTGWEITVIGAGHAQWVDGTPSGGEGGCISGPQETDIIQFLSHTIMVVWAEKIVYNKDITYWTTTWINDMKKLNYVDYRLK